MVDKKFVSHGFLKDTVLERSELLPSAKSSLVAAEVEVVEEGEAGEGARGHVGEAAALGHVDGLLVAGQGKRPSTVKLVHNIGPISWSTVLPA